MKKVLVLAVALVVFGGALAYAQTTDPIETIRQHYAAINRSAPDRKSVV